MAITFFSTHSGAGGACQGAKQAGLTLLGGIEIDQYCVDLHRANFGDGIRHESILDTPIKQLPDFDFLWSSPPCPSFSVAKTDGEETPEDIAQALRVCDLIRIKKPRHFALENVRGYVDSQSFYSILSTLKELGYNTHHTVYDTANFGVPQNRHRLILRASRDPLGDLAQTHSKQCGLWWQPWEGWYSAVADLLPTCKESQLTTRQLQALSKKGWNLKSVLVEGADSAIRDRTIRGTDEPCITITANQGGGGRLPKAVLVDGKANSYGTTYTICNGEDRIFTVTANNDRNVVRAILVEGKDHTVSQNVVRDYNQPSNTVIADMKGHAPRAVLLKELIEHADIRALDYRCLARLQTFPDTYRWGKSASKNCKSIGNAVPSLFAQRVIESIVGCFH